MSNQSGVQAAIRESTGTTLDYNGDWSALFDQDGISAGDWNGRMLAWINSYLGTSYASLITAQQAFAVDQGFNNWSSMNTLVLGAMIQLSASTIAEDASVADVIGTLSVANGSGSYTFTITADPSSKFQIATDELQVAASLDYETATSHSVTIEADNGVDDPISRTFTVFVTNVFEAASLGALSLSASTIEEASAENTVVGSIVGATIGSTITMTDTAAGRFKLSGGNVVAGATATDYALSTSHSITLRETLADSANSPRDSVISITVTELETTPATAIIWGTGNELVWGSGNYLTWG